MQEEHLSSVCWQSRQTGRAPHCLTSNSIKQRRAASSAYSQPQFIVLSKFDNQIKSKFGGFEPFRLEVAPLEKFSSRSSGTDGRCGSVLHSEVRRRSPKFAGTHRRLPVEGSLPERVSGEPDDRVDSSRNRYEPQGSSQSAVKQSTTARLAAERTKWCQKAPGAHQRCTHQKG